MEAREIYNVLQSIVEPIHAHSDQMVAIAKWIEAEFEYKPRKQANCAEQSDSNIPLVRCFETYGETIIKELGFEYDHKYNHDHFHTNRYRKGLLMVEFTYEGFTLKTVELIIDETFCKPITYTELQALTPILGVIPE